MKKSLTIISLLAATVAGCNGSGGPRVVDPSKIGAQDQGGNIVPLGYQSLASSSTYPFYGMSSTQGMTLCLQECGQVETDAVAKRQCKDECSNQYFGSMRGLTLNQNGLPRNYRDQYGISGVITSQWSPVMNRSYGQRTPRSFVPYVSRAYNQDPRMSWNCSSTDCTDEVDIGYTMRLGECKGALDLATYCTDENPTDTVCRENPSYNYEFMQEPYRKATNRHSGNSSNEPTILDGEYWGTLGKDVAREVFYTADATIKQIVEGVAGMGLDVIQNVGRGFNFGRLSRPQRAQAMACLQFCQQVGPTCLERREIQRNPCPTGYSPVE